MFIVDWTAFFIVLVLALSLLAYWLWDSRYRSHPRSGAIGFGGMTYFGLGELGQSWRVRWQHLPRFLQFGALICLCFAFVRPQLCIEKPTDKAPRPVGLDNIIKMENIELPTEGLALYLVLDQSGSMQEPMRVYTDAGTKRARRMDVLKSRVADFVRARPNDMLGLVGFARAAHVLSPLTLDHDAILETLASFDCVSSQQEDGTALAYALFKTVNLIEATKHYAGDRDGQKAAYDIKGTSIVLLTDGFSNPNPLDASHKLRSMSLAQAAEAAKNKGIRVYIVNIEPLIQDPQYASEYNDLKNAAEYTGGGLFVAGDSKALTGIFSRIDQLETSLLPQARHVQAQVHERTAGAMPKNWHTYELFPYLLACGLALMLGAHILDTTILRKVPQC